MLRRELPELSNDNTARLGSLGQYCLGSLVYVHLNWEQSLPLVLLPYVTQWKNENVM